MAHASALLTPRGRLALARSAVDHRWPLRRAAEPVQVSASARWAAWYRESGRGGRRIIKLRVIRRWVPGRHHPGLHPLTVHRCCPDTGSPRPADLAGPVDEEVIRRYEHDRPGDIVHVDIKKLERIPDGGGHRVDTCNHHRGHTLLGGGQPASRVNNLSGQYS